MTDDEDDDWFERAFDDEGEPAGDTADTDGAGDEDEDEDGSGDGDAPDADRENAPTGGAGVDDPGDAFRTDPGEAPEEDAGEWGDDSFGEAADEAFGAGTGADASGESEPGGIDDDPFGGDTGADAFEQSDRGASFGGDERSAGRDAGEGSDLFEEDFASAFENAGGGSSGFGGGPSGGGGSADSGLDGPAGFEEAAEYDSDVPRISLGIEGLDAMIQGGIPAASLIVAIGGAGTGKTTFGLQFLAEGIENGERGVFITLEESRDRIVTSATEKGWPFEEYVENGDLAVVDLDPVEMANSLQSIRNELPRLVEEFDASRLVLDSVSLLEMMYDEQATRRTEIYDFARSLKRAGVTTMLTSEASEDSPFASRHGIIEYLTDAVLVLQYIRTEEFRETRLAVEIQKIRDANHSRETKPYEITNRGINVYRQANIF